MTEQGGLKPTNKEIANTLCNVAQFLDGWHTDTAWTEWDAEVRKDVSRLQQYFDGLTAESRPSPSEGLSEEEKQLAKDIEWRKLFEKEVLTEEEARNLIKPYIHRELPGDVLVYNVRDYDVITLLMSHSRPAEKWISVKEKIEALREDCGEDGNYQTYPANQIIDEVLKCFPEGDRV